MSREQLKTRVMEEIDRRLPEFKDLLRDVVRIPTDNPPGDTTACVTFLAQYLKERGLPADVYEPRPTFQSLVSYKKGRRDGRNLVLRAPGPVSGWRPEGVVLRSLLRRVPGRQDPGSRGGRHEGRHHRLSPLSRTGPRGGHPHQGPAHGDASRGRGVRWHLGSSVAAGERADDEG